MTRRPYTLAEAVLAWCILGPLCLAILLARCVWLTVLAAWEWAVSR